MKQEIGTTYQTFPPEREEALRSSYDEQITAIKAKLTSGTTTIKQGHRVAGLNPSGVEKAVPLTPKQRTRLEFNLAVLQYYRQYPSASAITQEDLPPRLGSDNLRTAFGEHYPLRYKPNRPMWIYPPRIMRPRE